jgi:glycerol-1-phosphate dehydrogenase [NAD(P)+]
MRRSFVQIPEIVRIEPGALHRVGAELARAEHHPVILLQSAGLIPEALESVDQSLRSVGISVSHREVISDATVDRAFSIVQSLPPQGRAVVGLGGGKALDTAKYVAMLTNLPYYAVPTSLSNDGFCAPQSSLVLAGRRRSLPTGMPYAVVVDTDICQRAPIELWCSGVGDLAAKLSAVTDWRLALATRSTPMNDFAALLSDATVFQFMGRPVRDTEGTRLLATSLMLNGVAMEMAGSSRPASGSEHLVSHALDKLTERPHLHGLQVGVATFISVKLQGGEVSRLQALFTTTGFWDVVAKAPFDRAEWLEATRLAPTVKDDFFTVLSTRDCLPEVERMLDEDECLRRCVV